MLKAHRQQQGLSQKQLADALDLDYTLISKMESGKVLPSEPDDVLRFALALGLTFSEADELLGSAPRFANIRFKPSAAPFFAGEEDKMATWLNMLTNIVRAYAVERKASADDLAAHLAVFAGVLPLMVFIIDPAHREKRPRLKRLVLQLAARDVRIAAIMLLQGIVVKPFKIDANAKRQHSLMVWLVIELAKLSHEKVDLAMTEVYSASLTASQRNALRHFRAEIERKAPGLLSIELPSM